jgi:PTS system nitrogen regulatory IIA component
MSLTTIFTPERIHLHVPASCKKLCLQSVAAFAASSIRYKKEIIFEALCEREKLGSTAIGKGVAIPHVRLVGLDTMVGFFTRLERPIPFDALDGDPVDLLFVLLAPANAATGNIEHIKTLATLSRLMRDDVMRAQLRLAEDALSVMALLEQKALVAAA